LEGGRLFVSRGKCRCRGLKKDALFLCAGKKRGHRLKARQGEQGATQGRGSEHLQLEKGPLKGKRKEQTRFTLFKLKKSEALLTRDI